MTAERSSGSPAALLCVRVVVPESLDPTPPAETSNESRIDDRPTSSAISSGAVAASIAADEFSLAYQPKLNLRTRRIDGVEALARWTPSSGVQIPPDKFVLAMEAGNSIRLFTNWVVERALADQRRLAARGFLVAISINVSASLLSDAAFIAGLLATAVDLPAELRLEITETAVIADPDAAFASLAALTKAGIGIAVDDYGSGLSSLTYLQRIPACELKIDKSFIVGMSVSARDPLLVRSTIDLAHALDMQVTAEGVETYSTLDLLRAMGCDHAQGFLISRPLPFGALVELFATPAGLSHLIDLAPKRASESYWKHHVGS